MVVSPFPSFFTNGCFVLFPVDLPVQVITLLLTWDRYPTKPWRCCAFPCCCCLVQLFHWAAGWSLVLLRSNDANKPTPPPKSKIDTKKDGFWQVSPFKYYIAILGIHVSFRGCRCSSWEKETYQSKKDWEKHMQIQKLAKERWKKIHFEWMEIVVFVVYIYRL